MGSLLKGNVRYVGISFEDLSVTNYSVGELRIFLKVEQRIRGYRSISQESNQRNACDKGFWPLVGITIVENVRNDLCAKENHTQHIHDR